MIPLRRRAKRITLRLSAALRSRLTEAKDEAGSALIETAAALTILLTVIFGTMSMSIAIYVDFVVADVARETTRYAMVRGNTFTTDCTAPGYANCIAQPADIQTYARSLGFPAINTSSVTVTTTWRTSAGAACGTADTCKTPGNQVHVTVTYAYPLTMPFLSSRTLNLASTAQMVIAQ
jgi:Flp pilus assembly protein TadG